MRLLKSGFISWASSPFSAFRATAPHGLPTSYTLRVTAGRPGADGRPMRRFGLWVALPALTLFAVLAPSASHGASVSYRFVITHGESGGALNFGAVTDGAYRVTYPISLCFSYEGDYCPAFGNLVIAFGTQQFSAATWLVPLNQTWGRVQPGFNEAIWSRTAQTSLGQITTLLVRHHFSHCDFSCYGASLFLDVQHKVSGVYDGFIVVFGNEVDVPAPKTAGLMVTAALIFGAYALRRMRRVGVSESIVQVL